MLKELEKHEFIPKRSTIFYLKPHVVVARTLTKRMWDIIK